ncbi:MAG: alpha/beta hydrolase-fold protein [Gemmataceae bacterium]
MIGRHYFRLVPAAVLLLSAAALPAQESAKATPRVQTKKYDFKDAKKEMEYGLFVPSKYDKAKPTPLIVALHGLYSNPTQILSYPGFTDLAEKNGYILAAPMGYNSKGWYGQTPPFGGKPDPENLYELSEQDVMNVLEIVRKDYAIDPQRVYLMGHSMGGGGTIHLAIQHPDLWSALAPIAPAIFHPVRDLEKIKHIPIILIQGDKDNLVRVAAVRPWAEKMKELKMTYMYDEVPGGDHISVAIKELSKVFEFFNAHTKPAKKTD